jgi:hypothetical protein
MSVPGTCGSCTPNDGNFRPGGSIPNYRREPRRQDSFSWWLHQASGALQNPSTVTLREAAIGIMFLYALVRACFTSASVYKVLAQQDVGLVCNGVTALQCLWRHIWILLWLGIEWAGQVVPWGILAVVVVFLGEEVVASRKPKPKK